MTGAEGSWVLRALKALDRADVVPADVDCEALGTETPSVVAEVDATATLLITLGFGFGFCEGSGAGASPFFPKKLDSTICLPFNSSQNLGSSLVLVIYNSLHISSLLFCFIQR